MRKIKISFALIAVISMISMQSFAQDDEKGSPFSLSLDLMSRYVWRGTDYGAGPSIQPGVEYSKGGFAVGAWGAYTFNKSASQEFDLYACYTIKDMFTILVTDYFFPNEVTGYNYFDYKESTTGHVFEGTLCFNGTDKVPLSVFVATNFYGADAKHINSDGSTGKIMYSTYAEVGYSFKYVDVFMGVNCTAADTAIGETGYYGNSVGVVNLGATFSKSIKLGSKFSLPLTISVITNPQAEKVYLVGGFSF
jgi:hypothetical protein